MWLTPGAAGAPAAGTAAVGRARERRVERRDFVAMLGVGLAVTLAGCDSSAPVPPAGSGVAPPPSGTGSTAGLPTGTPAGSSSPPGPVDGVPSPPPLPAIPRPRPGPPRLVSHAPGRTRQVALTIDDGYCDECVDGYVAIAELTGIHLTFSPNGTYRDNWEPRAERLRGLIAAGQVQIGNHTWSHLDLRSMSDAGIRREIQRNEGWIERTFGVTARPWFRPPFGFRSPRTDEVAGELGYTRILLWDGTFGDSRLLTPRVLLEQAREYLQPGVVMLGHANHPTAVQIFDRVRALLAERRLDAVTLDEMFGTSRATG
jgi:peptidoglycan/xylan/chitin deacetylase (PgdA/CDA1 family)